MKLAEKELEAQAADAELIAAARDALQRETAELKDRISGARAVSLLALPHYT